MPSIMIQGTTSSAGKSLVAAGLCRIFRQDGFSVAPFKSQNMALNSFVTRDGLEMGRAQVMQAEAAGVEPSVLMNPILLKPTSDVGSQVIVNGEVVGTMRAAEYFAYKRTLRPVVQAAYQSLAAQYDIIVLEGAGSPAEINLKQEDIVNMGMAELSDSPVLIVGDIDRGGVFASLYGTVSLLEPHEKARVRGLVINKFRGDLTILRPGLSMLEDLTLKPVLGVIPYLTLDLDDEDSLSPRLTQTQRGVLDVAVLRLPRISNFTDFNALSRHPAVGLRYVSRMDELGAPDLILLPGTKNTMGDLLWLRQNGLEAAIQKHAAAGGCVLGICGGYQMLGMTLADPDLLEQGGTLRGMELLPIDTVFAPQKVRTRVSGTVTALGNATFTGYEIHMGRSTRRDHTPAFATCMDETEDGATRGNVCGSYIHGILDGDVGTALINQLLTRKGLSPTANVPDPATYKEAQYDALADALRQSLDLDRIYAIMGVNR